MKKRKMILSVMLLLSITTGCAAGEAKALSDSKGRMSLSQQIAKCNSKESAISIAENGIEKIFGANKYDLTGDASYNQDSSVQPDGWFVQLYDGDWEYFKILGIILSCGWFSSDGGGSTGSDAGWRSGIVRDKTVALFL